MPGEGVGRIHTTSPPVVSDDVGDSAIDGFGNVDDCVFATAVGTSVSKDVTKVGISNTEGTVSSIVGAAVSKVKPSAGV